MTQAERMIDFENRLERLENHEKKNSDLLFDNGGGFNLRLTRLEDARRGNKNIFPVVMSVLSFLTSLAMIIIVLLKG